MHTVEWIIFSNAVVLNKIFYRISRNKNRVLYCLCVIWAPEVALNDLGRQRILVDGVNLLYLLEPRPPNSDEWNERQCTHRQNKCMNPQLEKKWAFLMLIQCNQTPWGQCRGPVYDIYVFRRIVFRFSVSLKTSLYNIYISGLFLDILK